MRNGGAGISREAPLDCGNSFAALANIEHATASSAKSCKGIAAVQSGLPPAKAAGHVSCFVSDVSCSARPLRVMSQNIHSAIS
jgi:hypothetical protein